MRCVLCPRCELNYIIGNDEYCKVCLQELRGSAVQEPEELCSVCNENPVIPGRDICEACLREMNTTEGEDTDAAEAETHQQMAGIGEMDSVAQMDEIIPDVKEGDKEYGTLSNPMSLEDAREEEEEEDREDEDNADM